MWHPARGAETGGVSESQRPPADVAVLLEALDLALGVAVVVAGAARAALEPQFLSESLRPGRALQGVLRPVVRRGRQWRRHLLRETLGAVDARMPDLIEAAMSRLQPTRLVQEYVDLDELVAAVDVDAIAARLDIEAVVARVDVDEVAQRLNIEAVLDRIDLTETVQQRVDLKAVVDAVLAQADLPLIVEQVLDEIDLPEVIRASTGTMASGTVQTVRMQSVNADEVVGRLARRFATRRRLAAPGEAR